MKALSRWLWRDKRAREHHLMDLATKDAKNDRRHVRRRMTDAEVVAVIAAAEGWPTNAPGRPYSKGCLLTAEMLRIDLKAAGVPYETDEGVADIHASRGTYISNVVSSGASVKTCQVPARHSDPGLTIGIYAKASLHDISGAVEALPDLTSKPSAPESEVLSATGTDTHITTQRYATSNTDEKRDDLRNILSMNKLRDDVDDNVIEFYNR